MKLEKITYRQPYSIKEFRVENPALEYHLKQKQHHREKYQNKYLNNKYAKRLKWIGGNFYKQLEFY